MEKDTNYDNNAIRVHAILHDYYVEHCTLFEFHSYMEGEGIVYPISRALFFEFSSKTRESRFDLFKKLILE